VLDELVNHFKVLILEKKLKAGDRLLSERELSLQLGVSRSTLREALRALEMLGLISSSPGQGSFILPPNSEGLSSFFELMLSLNPAISENVQELRIIIECEAVRLAVRRATPAEIANLGIILDRMALNSDGNDFGAEADFEFHNAVIKATHNDALIFLYRTIENLLKQSHYDRRVAIFDVPGVRENLVKIHIDVYEAMEERNVEASVERMREHFRYVNRLMKKKGILLGE
jgi:DNA-binding FadR family transcriptional regulator